MTYNVFSGTLHPTQSINQSINHCSSTTTVSLTKGFTSHSTQNRSHRRRSSQPISWLTLKKLSPTQQKQPGIEQVQKLADISHSRYIVTAMKPMHQLQIHPTVHHKGAPPTIPPHYIVVCAVVWECDEGQTDRQTHTRTSMTNIHFASSTTHTKHKQSSTTQNKHKKNKSQVWSPRTTSSLEMVNTLFYSSQGPHRVMTGDIWPVKTYSATSSISAADCLIAVPCSTAEPQGHLAQPCEEQVPLLSINQQCQAGWPFFRDNGIQGISKTSPVQ